MGRDINGVIEHGTFWSGTARQRSATRAREPAATGRGSIYARAVESVPQASRRVGEILQQIGIDVETDDKGLVFGPQNLAEEIGAYFLFHFQNALLAPA